MKIILFKTTLIFFMLAAFCIAVFAEPIVLPEQKALQEVEKIAGKSNHKNNASDAEKDKSKDKEDTQTPVDAENLKNNTLQELSDSTQTHWMIKRKISIIAS